MCQHAINHLPYTNKILLISRHTTNTKLNNNEQSWTDHSTAKVVDYKIFPRNFAVLSLVESKKPYYCHACDHHEKQPIAWIIWITNWSWPAVSSHCQFWQLILCQIIPSMQIACLPLATSANKDHKHKSKLTSDNYMKQRNLFQLSGLVFCVTLCFIICRLLMIYCAVINSQKKLANKDAKH